MGQKKDAHTKFAVVVQENNECYSSIDDFIRSLNLKFYAYIHHEADEEHNNNHYHLVIDFGNGKGKTFDEMHEIFKDCHEEVINQIWSCCAYLTHETPTAIEDGKRLYDRKEVITNDLAEYTRYANKGSLQLFDETQLEYYILEKGYITYWHFLKHFGAKQVQPFKISIDYAIQHFNMARFEQDIDFFAYKKKVEDITSLMYDLHSSKEEIFKKVRKILNIVDK